MTLTIPVLPGYMRQTKPVQLDPGALLSPWCLVKVFCADGGVSRHLLGRANYVGGLPTSIVSIDVVSLTAITSPGMKDDLGGPGLDRDAQRILTNWLTANGHLASSDQTKAISRLHSVAKDKISIAL